MVQPPSPNIANFGVAHPIPGGTRMTNYSPREAPPRPITLAGQRIPTLPKDPYLIYGLDPRDEPLSTTLLPPASTLGPDNLDQSPPFPAPPASTQRLAPNALTMKTINIILKTSPPALKIIPATLIPPTLTLGPANVEQSPPCTEPPDPTQRPAPHASTLHTPNQPPIPISHHHISHYPHPYSTSHMGYTRPPRWPHGSNCTCHQGWIPLTGPVPDVVVHPVVPRG